MLPWRKYTPKCNLNLLTGRDTQYYEAMESLPSGLQRPLWKSPSPNSKKPICAHNRSSSRENFAERIQSYKYNTVAEQDSANDHRRYVSKHRHQWAPPATPPDYWTIAFPDTQQVDDINRRANDIHEKKRQQVENEARCVIRSCDRWLETWKLCDNLKIANQEVVIRNGQSDTAMYYGSILNWLYYIDRVLQSKLRQSEPIARRRSGDRFEIFAQDNTAEDTPRVIMSWQSWPKQYLRWS